MIKRRNVLEHQLRPVHNRDEQMKDNKYIYFVQNLYITTIELKINIGLINWAYKCHTK